MKKLLQRLLAQLPCKLPMGVTEFHTWADSILDTYELPNNDSTKFALASAIMHLDATSAFKPKAYFGKMLIKGAASQVAHFLFQELKNKQLEAAAKAQQEAIEAQNKVEDTTQSSESSTNEPQG